MVNKELADYIKRQFEHGHDTATIREHLLKHGYTEAIADEALHSIHPPAKPQIKGLKYLPFSGKKIAVAFVIIFGLAGLGFALMNMLGNGDLAGAATEAERVPMPQIIEQEEIEEELPEEEIVEDAEIIEALEQEPLEETDQESRDGSEETEEAELVEAQEVETEETEGAGCTSDSSCDTGYVCYKNACSIDNDRDLLSDEQEQSEGTDPLDQDTDDDGYFDSQEIDENTDALDAADPGYTSCSETRDCPAGSTCTEQGVCVACEDSDALNYKKKGVTQGVHYTTGKAILAQDNCKSDGMLMEYYCRDAAAFYFEEVDCEEEFGTGYSCSAGKCVS